MIVAGGVYFERCLTPAVSNLFGSGGRAAAALSSFSDVTLHTFFPLAIAEEVVWNLGSFGVKCEVHASDAVVQFFYNFPLSMPRIAPVPVPQAESVRIFGEKVIRFGCLEGEMIVEADVAVYDPQSGQNPRPYRANGSKAERLAIVLNEGELGRLTGMDPRENDAAVLVAALTDKPDV